MTQSREINTCSKLWRSIEGSGDDSELRRRSVEGSGGKKKEALEAAASSGKVRFACDAMERKAKVG